MASQDSTDNGKPSLSSTSCTGDNVRSAVSGQGRSPLRAVNIGRGKVLKHVEADNLVKTQSENLSQPFACTNFSSSQSKAQISNVISSAVNGELDNKETENLERVNAWVDTSVNMMNSGSVKNDMNEVTGHNGGAVQGKDYSSIPLQDLKVSHVQDTSELTGGSLMRALVMQQDPGGYENEVDLGEFDLYPAGKPVICSTRRKKQQATGGIKGSSVGIKHGSGLEACTGVTNHSPHSSNNAMVNSEITHRRKLTDEERRVVNSLKQKSPISATEIMNDSRSDSGQTYYSAQRGNVGGLYGNSGNITSPSSQYSSANEESGVRSTLGRPMSSSGSAGVPGGRLQAWFEKINQVT